MSIIFEFCHKKCKFSVAVFVESGNEYVKKLSQQASIFVIVPARLFAHSVAPGSYVSEIWSTGKEALNNTAAFTRLSYIHRYTLLVSAFWGYHLVCKTDTKKYKKTKNTVEVEKSNLISADLFAYIYRWDRF